MNFRLQFYNDEELAKIIQIAGSKLNKPIETDSALEIAKRSRGTPRIALRLLKRVRDFSDVAGEEAITLKTTKYALDKLGVNANGFDELDLSYLRLLCNAKKPLGLSTISAALSEDEETIEDVIEPFLLANGFVERTARGRIATRKSYELLHLSSERSLF
jgi:Holliday junction DNA helicase RuvB